MTDILTLGQSTNIFNRQYPVLIHLAKLSYNFNTNKSYSIEIGKTKERDIGSFNFIQNAPVIPVEDKYFTSTANINVRKKKKKLLNFF